MYITYKNNKIVYLFRLDIINIKFNYYLLNNMKPNTENFKTFIKV